MCHCLGAEGCTAEGGVGEMPQRGEFLPKMPFPVCWPLSAATAPLQGRIPKSSSAKCSDSPPSVTDCCRIAAGQGAGQGCSAGRNALPGISCRNCFLPPPHLPHLLCAACGLHPRACNLLFSLLKFKLVTLEHLWSR